MPLINQKRFEEAVQLHEAGDLDRAEAIYRTLLERAPKHPDLLHLYGALRGQKGDTTTAIALIGNAIRLRPDNLAYYANLAAAYHAQGDADTAATIMRDTGNRQLAAGLYTQAIESYAEGLELQPAHAQMLTNTGVACAKLHREDEAMAWFERAIAADPHYAPAVTNRANILWARLKHAEALADYRRAIQLDPNDAAAQHNLGFALTAIGQPDEGIACYDRAIAIKPGLAKAHYDRAMSLLLKGRLDEAFPELEWRWAADYQYAEPRRPYRQPVWRGGPVKGKLLVTHEQGFGDAITFCRFVPELTKRGYDVLLEAKPPLIRLFQQSFAGIDRIGIVAAPPADSAAKKTVPLPQFGAYVGMMSLPGRLGVTMGSLAAEPYLRVEPDLVAQWNRQLAPAVRNSLKIGIVWAGDPRPHHREANALDRQRSLSLEQFSQFLDVPGVSIVSLQKGTPAEQLKSSLLAARIYDPMPDAGDFADTAAIIANLDLVITVDTAIANLAGAMGKPVWVLVRLNTDWRWLESGSTTPWYPSARVFRQVRLGDWKPVLAEVRQALTKNGQ